MAQFNPYQRGRSYVETGSVCLVVWRRLMGSLIFCVFIIAKHSSPKKIIIKLGFLQNFSVGAKMKRTMPAAKPPIQQLLAFQNSEHYYQIHDTNNIVCDPHPGLSFQFYSRILTGRGTCHFECDFTFFLDAQKLFIFSRI